MMSQCPAGLERPRQTNKLGGTVRKHEHATRKPTAVVIGASGDGVYDRPAGLEDRSVYT